MNLCAASRLSASMAMEARDMALLAPPRVRELQEAGLLRDERGAPFPRLGVLRVSRSRSVLKRRCRLRVALAPLTDVKRALNQKKVRCPARLGFALASLKWQGQF